MLWPCVCTVAHAVSTRCDTRDLNTWTLRRRTLCEGVDGECSVWVLGQVLQCDLWLALSYHEMYDDQALEDNGPRGIAQSVRQGAEYLSDSSFAGVRRDQDVFDIFGLWGGKLHMRVRQLFPCYVSSSSAVIDQTEQMPVKAHAYLDLGAALDALLEGARHGSWRR